VRYYLLSGPATRRAALLLAVCLLSGCQTTTLPSTPGLPAILPAPSSATEGSTYPTLPAHKAEAIALPIAALNATSSAGPIHRPVEVSLTSGHPTPSAAAIAALDACEQARKVNSIATLACELRKRNNQFIHNTAELTVGLRADRPAFIWQIQHQNTRVYLAGSIHVLKPTISPPPSYLEAFEQATALVLEVDQRNQTPEQLQALVQHHALLPGQTTLSQLLSDKEYDQVIGYLDGIGADTASANYVKPAMLLLQASALEYTSIGYLPEHGIERVFQAKLGNRPLLGLETVDQQFAAATALPLNLQADLLVESIGEADTTPEQISTLVHAWLSGDERYLASQFEDATTSVAANQWLDDLLAKRNIGMAKGIDGLLRGVDERLAATDPQTIFVLVGAAHLVGNNSVIALLEKQGYKLERLNQGSLSPAE